jgi:hypothetical protein
MDHERAIVLEDWPQPNTANDAEIQVDRRGLVIRYSGVTVRFPVCFYLTFGTPNDEALHMHRLWGHGLRHYTVHQVENSSLIHLVERQTAGSLGMKHYVFTFKDSTIECVVKGGGLDPAGSGRQTVV